jgi:hypothetical protein
MRSLRQIAKTAGRHIAQGGRPMSHILYKMTTGHIRAYNNLHYEAIHAICSYLISRPWRRRQML